ncbi:MAG: DUF4297 domain-containing protein [Alphaproteobacteria bacterium]|jgi:hypothetical protein|nr:DUF4297 domain-containing protein [Alphaproteobacteria bacterium]
MKANNGGAIAIKGFNYQDAVISLICIKNYMNKDFSIIVENKEDVDIFLGNKIIFTQIKGTRLSIAKMTSSKDKILVKNLENEDKNSKEVRYKIITLNSFIQKDKKELKEVNHGVLFKNIYSYSEKQLQIIEKALLKEGFSEKELKNKLKNSYVYFTPFENNFDDSYTFLLGEMSKNNIKVDGNRGQVSLNELAKRIKMASEIVIKDEDYEIKDKTITNEDLKIIFLDNAGYKFKIELLEEISSLNFYQKSKIKKLILKNLAYYKNLTEEIKFLLDDFEVNKDINDLFLELKNKITDDIWSKENELVIYSIIIDLISNKIGENL